MVVCILGPMSLIFLRTILRIAKGCQGLVPHSNNHPILYVRVAPFSECIKNPLVPVSTFFHDQLTISASVTKRTGSTNLLIIL